MTRDEQRKFKELTQVLPKILKEKIKTYKIKKKDYMIWFSNKELFFSAFIDVRVDSDGKCICRIIEQLKPLWLDDLLWNFLKMEDNKKAALSLRAVGAFTVNGSEVYKDSQELDNWSIQELENCVEIYLEHFYQTIQSSTVYDFYKNMEVSSYNGELRKVLSLVHDEEYQEALDFLSTKGRGELCNEDIWINEAVKEYCENKLVSG